MGTIWGLYGEYDTYTTPKYPRSIQEVSEKYGRSIAALSSPESEHPQFINEQFK